MISLWSCWSRRKNSESVRLFARKKSLRAKIIENENQLTRGFPGICQQLYSFGTTAFGDCKLDHAKSKNGSMTNLSRDVEMSSLSSSRKNQENRNINLKPEKKVFTNCNFFDRLLHSAVHALSAVNPYVRTFCAPTEAHEPFFDILYSQICIASWSKISLFSLSVIG